MSEELTLDDLLVSGPQPETIRGKTVYIKRLNALEGLAYGDEMQQQREALDITQQATGNGDPKQAGLRFTALMVKHHVCDSKGNLLFEGKTPEQIVATVDDDWLNDLYDRVLAKRSSVSLEDAEKNS